MAKAKSTSKLILIVLILIFPEVVSTQVYTLNEIKTNLLNNPPNTGDPLLREESILSLDYILKQESIPTSNQVIQFYHSMLDNVSDEIKNPVSSTVIWLVYNHGFVVKTPNLTLAFDLVTGYDGTGYHPLFDILKNDIKIMFISHYHGDHTSRSIANAVRLGGGYVFSPNNMSPGDSLTLLGFRIKAHNGLHSRDLRIFEVVTPSGLKILHTGDNQTSQTLPLVKEVDVLLLNAWVNESGRTSAVTGMRNCLDKLNPPLMIPGHIQEMGHDYNPNSVRGRVTYEEAFEVDDIKLNTKVMVMAWGERYENPDKYDKAYVYSAKTFPSFLPASENTVQIVSKVINAKNHNISVLSMIESENMAIRDTIELYDDGNHNDGSASDGLYGDSWSQISQECIYNVHVNVHSLNGNYSDTFHHVAKFTNIGPLALDSYTVSNPYASHYMIKLSLINKGLSTTAANVTAELTSPDTVNVTNIISSEGDAKNIENGQIVELDQLFNLYTTGLADSIPLTISIFSNGYHFWTDSFFIDLTAVSIIESENLPVAYSLSQNYPNPFNPSTTINYQLPARSAGGPITNYVNLAIYNLLGQKVITLVNERQQAGSHNVVWDAGSMASGVYYYRIKAGEFQQVRKMILIR